MGAFDPARDPLDDDDVDWVKENRIFILESDLDKRSVIASESFAIIDLDAASWISGGAGESNQMLAGDRSAAVILFQPSITGTNREQANEFIGWVDDVIEQCAVLCASDDYYPFDQIQYVKGTLQRPGPLQRKAADELGLTGNFWWALFLFMAGPL